MQIKKLRYILLILLFIIFTSNSLFSKTVSITQLGFIIKKSIPSIKIIAVLYPVQNKNAIIKDAKMAYTILKKKIVIYDIAKQFEITKKINRISRYKDVAVIIMTDKNIFHQKTIKFISGKLLKKGIPLFTNRMNDTKFDALISMFYKSNKLEKHLNKLQLQKLNIDFANNFIEKFIIDVE